MCGEMRFLISRNSDGEKLLSEQLYGFSLRRIIKKITQMNYFYFKLLSEEAGAPTQRVGVVEESAYECDAVNSEAIKRVASPQLP